MSAKYLGLTESILVIDGETGSPVDIKKEGQYRYWEHPDTRTYMVAQRWLDSDVTILTDFETEDRPALHPSSIRAIQSPPEEHMLAAANVTFDQAALRRLGYDTPDEKWIDILEMAYILGFSGRLDDVLKQVFDDVQKDPEGTRLITYFSVQRHLWHEAPEKWDAFRRYCIHDAEIEERLLRWCFQWLNTPGFAPVVRKIHKQSLDYRRFNRRGIPVDLAAVDGALQIRGHETARLMDELKEITQLANPNSRDQLLDWCRAQGSHLQNLQKDSVRDELLIQRANNDGKRTPLIEALERRQEIGKTSVKKFDALKRSTSDDGFLRGGWQFYGASRTGRVAGRVLNPANLARPSHSIPVEEVVEWLPQGDAETLRALFPQLSVMDALSSCIRACLKAPPGRQWCVADLTSIESVGAAWLAGCDTVLDIFFAGRDTYTEMAAYCEGIPYEVVDKALRTLYKPVVLGGIYRLSGGGLIDYAASMGVELSEEKAAEQVRHLRQSWHEIPHYWKQLEQAAVAAVDNPRTCYSAYAVDSVEAEWEDEWGVIRRRYSYRKWPRVDYLCDGEFLFCALPSGRRLCYHRPRVDTVTINMRDGHSFDARALHYRGNDQKATGPRWKELQVHSGHLLENINQALCRDVLWNGLELAELDENMLVVGDVYDEALTLVGDNDTEALERLIGYLTTRPAWADERFFLGAEGYVSDRYRKD